MEETYWIWLGRIADSLGTLSIIVTLVISIITLWTIKREKKRLLETARNQSPTLENIEQKIQSNEGITSGKPVALIISATHNNVSISPNVKEFLKIQNWKIPIKEVVINGINSPSDQEQFMSDLIKQKREIQAKGFTEVHLFINAPMFACILTGSILKFWLPTKIYHFVQGSNKFYEYKTPIL